MTNLIYKLKIQDAKEEFVQILNENKGFFGKLSERIGNVLMAYPKIDEELFDELEEVLITSDIGMNQIMKIMDSLRENIKGKRLSSSEDVKDEIALIVSGMMDKQERMKVSNNSPLFIMMIGINGGGKTTTVAKLANSFVKENKSVLVAAADTFRAAASDQLSIWAERIGVNIIKHKEGADPSAVIYDAIQSAKAKGIDVLICDTAGRLHNKKNLMSELEKMNRVVAREYPEATTEVLLVLDATTGKNAISQAQEFSQIADVSGIVLTKLDGSAKGGIAITIADEYDIPIKFIGVGEKIEDLRVFDPMEFGKGVIYG